MKHFKNSLRLWIAASSVVGFFGGWVLLAHAPKPAQASQPAPDTQVELAPLPTLGPLPSISSQPSTVQQLPSFSQPVFRSPRLRTGGS
jgi:hypothetical protein